MSNVEKCVRNILVWFGACGVWSCIGIFFLGCGVIWPSIVLFVFGGLCFLVALLNVVVLLKHGRGLNQLDKFPDILSD
jgi:hypothetical protein